MYISFVTNIYASGFRYSKLKNSRKILEQGKIEVLLTYLTLSHHIRVKPVAGSMIWNVVLLVLVVVADDVNDGTETLIFNSI